jgi:hypothetical protein
VKIYKGVKVIGVI